MKFTRKSLSVGAAAGIALLALAGCSEPSENVGSNNSTSGATEDAKDSASGSLTLYTSEPEDKVDQVVAAFNEEHPDVDVEVYRAGTGDLKARIEAEKTSGAVEADLIWAADAPTFETFKSDDLLAKLENVETGDVMDGAVDPDGYYVGTRIIPTVIAYNTSVIDETEAPKSWTDLTLSLIHI